MRWRIYYGDGSTFSDRDGTPFDAPPCNVQALAAENIAADRGFVIHQGKDIYAWRVDMNCWTPCDLPGMWDYLMLHCGPKAVLFGRSIRDDIFYEAVNRALNEGLG